MLRAIDKISHSHSPTDGEAPSEALATLTLPFAERQKSRLRATLDDGREIAVVLARGQVLRTGDRLRTETQEWIEIRAADEELALVRSEDSLLFARACYHLGNRHVPLAIRAGELRFQRDHVLEDMLRNLGLEVAVEKAPFDPEGGAYGHSHG